MSPLPENFPIKQKVKLTSREPLIATKKLIERLEEIQAQQKKKKTSLVHVSKVVKSAAFAYEKIRSAIDFKEEHLLRRGAIQRIVTRRLQFNQTSSQIAEGLINELIQSGYIKNDLVGVDDIKKTKTIIDKYLILIKTFSDKKEQGYFIPLASVEIEEQLVSHAQEEILLKTLQKSITSDLQKDKRNKVDSVQLSLALHTIFLKSDITTLRFYLWKKYYSSWTKISVDYLNLTFDKQKIIDITAKIESDIKNPANKKLGKKVKSYNPLFIILQKIISKDAKTVKKIFYHPQVLEEEARKIIEAYHANTEQKLHRSIIRAIIFVLITKVTLGVLVEIPYDLYLSGYINWLPLGINLVFPLFVMVLSASLINIPGKENTEKLVEDIKYIVYGREKLIIAENKVRFSVSAPMTMTLKILYLVVFGGVFALVIWALVSLDFNIVSGFFFFFFLSVVSFLAFRIRQSANDLLVTTKKEGMLSTIIDFLFLPFLKIGHWLAETFTGINFFLFFLDFIIEAPFKLVLEVLGNWIDFVKKKKEELTN